MCAVSADHPDVGDEMPWSCSAACLISSGGSEHPSVQSHAEVLYGARGIQRRVLLTTDSFALLPALVRGSRMVALVHERLARQVTGLKLLAPPVPIPEVQESMYWSASVDRDRGHIWLRDLLRGIAREL